VKRVRVFAKPIHPSKTQDATASNMFVFCDKSTGAARFHAEPDQDLNCTVERMASMLAIQCLVAGSDPGDFAILVPAAEVLTDRLLARAKELLDQGRAAGPATLSPRQREILHSVVCNRANKEIAWKLNISVRTVKFHISALLTKFRVANRSELARKAVGFLRPGVNGEEASESKLPSKPLVRREVEPIALQNALHFAGKGRNERFSQRILTA